MTPLSFTKAPRNFSGWRRAFLSLIIMVGGQVVMGADFTRTTAFNRSVGFSNSIQFVDFSAVVTPPSDEGTILFTLKRMDRSTLQLIPVADPVLTTLANGSASVSYPVPAALPPGGYTITAEYSGSLNFLPSHHVESILAIYPPGSRTLRTTNAAAIIIPTAGAASIYPADITVAGVAGVITNAAITLNGLTHPYPGDLDILLIGPGGQRVALFSDAGAGHSMDDIDVTISDWANYPIPFAYEVPYGTYRPTIYVRAVTNDFSIKPPFLTVLSNFNGLSPNGTWSLYVSDVEAPDAGIISGGWTLTVTTINSTPTISAIPDQATDEDTPLGPISFTVADSETAASNLIVTASSSNPAVVTDENLFIDGSDGNLTLTIFPQPDQFGTTLITVIVGDGEAAASNTFLVTVNSVNDAPTISPIPDQTADENTIVGPLLFSIGDIETPAANLTVTVDSSNPLLTPPNGIVLGGSDADRSVTITPALNQFGTAAITITVSDGQSIGTAAFSLTIHSTNDPPTISSLPDQTANEDTTIGPLEFTIADLETPADDLILSATSSNPALVPVGNIVLAGAGATRSVTITPATNKSGTTTISIQVSDGVNGLSNSFLVTILPVNDPPTASAISDQVIDEDTMIGPIPFTIADIETFPDELIVGVTSSNPTLVPPENLLLDGADTDRSITIIPATNQFGVASISISVSDGNATVTNTFLLTVNPVNDPPTISPISDQIVSQNGVLGPISFTIDDVETNSTLIVTTASSNPDLIPPGNIIIGGSGADRTVMIVPAFDQFGVAIVSILVSDGEAVATNSFQVTVNSVNNPPAITVIADQITNEDTTVGPISFTIGDLETPASDLTLNVLSSNTDLLPTQNIILSGVGSNRTVTLVPAADQSGASTVTIMVDDGETTVSNTFLVTFRSVNDPPTLDPIADLIVFQDSGLRTIHLTGISPGAEPGQSVIVSDSSDHPELIPDPAIIPDLVVSSATLTFTPAPGASGSSRITVTVKDNGGIENGGLDSFSRSFGVTVLPRPSLRISQIGPICLISFDSVVGLTYIIESRDSLSDPDWTPLDRLPGTGDTFMVPESNSPGSNKFYRVRVE